MRKISLITAVYNGRSTIGSAMETVRKQNYPELEYIVIDGMSSDGSDEVIAENRGMISKSIREADAGIYDALNKGVRQATGDIIGFLHADDLLAHSRVLHRINEEFERTGVDAVYGDLVYVDGVDPSQTIRYWKGRPYDPSRFSFGWMPPHPTCFITRECYEKYGLYRLDMVISADYELMLRMMVKNQIAVSFIPEVLVKMRIGGKSNRSWRNRRQANIEDALAWKLNGLRTPPLLRLTKPLRKVGQFFRKPPPDLE